MASVQGDLDTLQKITSGLLKQFEKGSKTSNELQALLDASRDVQVNIIRPDFRQRRDAIRLLSDIGDLTKIASLNLQELQFLLYPRRERKSTGRSPKSEPSDLSRQTIFANLQKHTNTFRRLGDYIENREDWSRLTPKAPRVPSVSPESAEKLLPAESSKPIISIPPSPFQPSVEEVEDIDDEETENNVEHVHYVHKEDSPATELPSTNPRRVAHPATPPQVVIRQATDPKQFDSPKRGKVDAPSSPLRSSMDAYDDVEDGDAIDEGDRHLHPSALPKIVTRIEKPAKSLKDLEQEIARLQVELQKYAESETTSPEVDKRKTSKHRSVDLGRGDELLTASGSRPRASTTAGSERPNSFVEGSSTNPYRSDMPPPPRPDAPRRTSSTKSKRHPSRSPRTPFSATEPQLDTYWEHGNAKTAAEMYGPDPRTSLPTVLETGHRNSQTGRPDSRYNIPADGFHFGDPNEIFQQFYKGQEGFGADFDLFGPPAGEASKPPQTRSRGNSRANDISPNSRPYISPHQLHESVPLEPNVREIAVSLEDMHFGTTKKFKIKRQKRNASGIVTTEERLLEVPIDRGLRPGSKIKFPNMGDQTAEGARELHFKLVEKPHNVFVRKGYDLHCTIEISLLDALCGWAGSITSICGKEVKFSHPGPTPANWSDDRAGLGMCTYKDPNARGDLIATVSIKYPPPLTDSQKRLIRTALGTGTSPRQSGNFF